MLRLLLCFLFTGILATDERAFILTAPKSLKIEKTEEFRLILFNVEDEGKVSLTLHSDNGVKLAEVEKVIPPGQNVTVIEFPVPKTDNYSGKIYFNGKFGEDDPYIISKESIIGLRRVNNILLLQTDKPIYKPNEKVNFRVLLADYQLKPIRRMTVDIWITVPSGPKVAQWKGVTLDDGIAQFTLPLVDEPPKGNWLIQAKASDSSYSSQSFEVLEYVLPKYEITITPPPYLLPTAREVTWKVCARYTYGEDVEGNIKFVGGFATYNWEKEKPPQITLTSEFFGCENFTISSEKLDLVNGNFNYRSLDAFAEVTEKGTGVTMNTKSNVYITRNPLELQFVDDENGDVASFKPGLPYYGRISVKHPDKKPARGKKIKLCAYHEKRCWNDEEMLENKLRSCKTYVSDKTGTVLFSIPPLPSDVNALNLEAVAIDYPCDDVTPYATRLNQPQASTRLTGWYSPRASFVLIEPEARPLPCKEGSIPINVRFTSNKSGSHKFYYQIIAKGVVVQSGVKHVSEVPPTKPHNDASSLPDVKGVVCFRNISAWRNVVPLPDYAGKFQIHVDKALTGASTIRVLVFYLKNREVISDSQTFLVEKCLNNEVSIETENKRHRPGVAIPITINASPDSFCSISAVDKSVFILRQSAQLTKDKIFQEMQQYDIGRYSYPLTAYKDRCNVEEVAPASAKLKHGGRRVIRPPPYRPSSTCAVKSLSQYLDAVAAFENAGILYLTDLHVETKPCQPNYFNTGGVCRPIEFGGGGAAADAAGPPGAAIPMAHLGNVYQKQGTAIAESAGFADSSPAAGPEIRTFFPETWLFELVNVGSTGSLLFSPLLPDTITEWNMGAVCANAETGLGASDQNNITTFKSFFVSLTLPYSIKRGEVSPVILSAFNYLEGCVSVEVGLEVSEGIELVSEDSKKEFCICGGKSEVVTFKIKATKLGRIPLKVYGHTSNNQICEDDVNQKVQDAIEQPLLVEPEGFPKEETITSFICPNASPNNIYEETVSLKLPEDVIPDSDRVFVAVYGDLMGPPLDSLDRLIQLPTGCGEQNLVHFTPIIFILDYLNAVKKLTEETKNKATSHLLSGYMRQMSFRHYDGSYSLFGPGRDQTGSVYVTAFTVRSFAQARPFIFIDEDSLETSANWIKYKQLPNGCFPKSADSPFSYSAETGLGQDVTPATSTAFVLIALLEAQKTEGINVQNALQCLEAKANPSNYSLAMFAYASALAKDEKAAQNYLSLLILNLTKTEDGAWYWRSSPDINVGRTTDIETAAYAMLAFMELDGPENLKNASFIAHWLTKRMNSFGGFISTQDTVLGLQALSKFAKLVFGEDLNMKIDVQTESLKKEFEVNSENQYILQTESLSSAVKVVEYKATGSGCALAQIISRYNVEKDPKVQGFGLKIAANNHCSFTELNVCMKYGRLGVSNMAILTVNMVTGYDVDTSGFSELSRQENLKLKHYEKSAKSVTFYFSQLTNEETCFRFNTTQLYKIENTVFATAKLLDYYDTSISAEETYNIPSSCEPI